MAKEVQLQLQGRAEWKQNWNRKYDTPSLIPTDLSSGGFSIVNITGSRIFYFFSRLMEKTKGCDRLEIRASFSLSSLSETSEEHQTFQLSTT